MNEVLQILTTVLTGTVTGVMLFYAHTLMRGLKTLDDVSFVKSFRAIDTAIINPVFLGSFLGGFGLSIVAAVVAVQDGVDSRRCWIAAAVLYTVGVLITFAVHVPKNNAIKATPENIDAKQATAYRKAFNEAAWTRWHMLRTLVFVVAFILQVHAL